jgi:multicomponent Na+:H+ antiporter subunit B
LPEEYRIFEDVIVRTIARVMVPFILLFALYILMHGHATPGGGFQAGVIIAADFVLLAIAFDMPELKRRTSQKIRLLAESFGPLNYAIIGTACILSGGYYLQYGKVPLPFSPSAVSAILISAVEIGIGITVMGMVAAMFLSMIGGGKHDTG